MRPIEITRSEAELLVELLDTKDGEAEKELGGMIRRVFGMCDATCAALARLPVVGPCTCRSIENSRASATRSLTEQRNRLRAALVGVVGSDDKAEIEAILGCMRAAVSSAPDLKEITLPSIAAAEALLEIRP